MELIRKRPTQNTNNLGVGIERWAQAAEIVIEAAWGYKKRKVRRATRKFELLTSAVPTRNARLPFTSNLTLVVFKLQRQLETFRALEADWDTYGASPITDAAIRQAGRILNSLSLQLAAVRGISMHVFPMRDGGVQIDLDKKTASVEIEVHPEATQTYLLFDTDGELIDSPHSLSAILRQFVAPLPAAKVA